MADDNDYIFDEDALREWWHDLDEHRGRRAELRRCHTLGEVQNTNAFQHSARYRLRDAGLRESSREQLAAVAGLLAHIREHAPEQIRFAEQMATPDSEGGRPPVSEGRFHRLLRKKDRAELYKPLRRVLPILGTPPRANIFEITQEVYLWGDAVRRRWAEDYYAVRFEGEPVPEVEGRKAMWKAWWDELKKQERRGERAALRRCSTLDDVMLRAGYHRLLHYLRKAGVYQKNDKWQHAAVAGVLAHIEDDDDRHRFAAQMALSGRAADTLADLDAEADDYKEKRREVRGQIQDGTFGSAPLSGLRFRRLVQTSDRAVLFRKLLRTLRLLEGRAHVADLADAVFFWNDNRRRDWSLDYYTHASSDES